MSSFEHFPACQCVGTTPCGTHPLRPEVSHG